MYQEQHTVVSNDFGLVNLKLGEGVPLLSQFRLIDWSLKSILVKIELSIGGSPFTTMGEEGFSSVPYSIYSNQSSYTDSLYEMQSTPCLSLLYQEIPCFLVVMIQFHCSFLVIHLLRLK